MRINGPAGTKTVGGKKDAKRSSGSGARFQVPQDSSAPASAGGVSQTAAVQNVDALLALQSVDDSLHGKRRKAVRQGNKMLDLLDSIRLGLLSGQVSVSVLKQLERLSAQVEASGDERIDAVMSDIELRVQVELAKLQA